VLLVDDNAALRVTLREQLASLHCKVHEAADFEQATRVLRSKEPIEFIISDFDLGSGANGLELARWVQDNGLKIPGAIISGHLQSFSGLPQNWQSLQKPVRLRDLRMILAAGRQDNAAAQSERTMPFSPQIPATVLVVEDNDGMRFVTVEMLRRAGYTAVEAATARDALLKLKDASIHLVITDLGLPDMPGAELAKEIARHYPAIEVLLMSGTPSRPGMARSASLTAEILHKPFSKDALTRTVEAALTRASKIQNG